MTSVKQKVKNITVNKLSQSEKYINEIYNALKILLDKNYKKYDFDTSMKNGQVFNEIKKIFEDPENFEGKPYKIQYKVMKAREFGIPQNRERTIIIGSMIDFNLDEEISKPKDFSRLEKIFSSNFNDLYLSLSQIEKRRFWVSIIDKIYYKDKKIEKIIFK